MVPCSSFLESVPGVCGVKIFMVAPECKIPKTVFYMVVLEVSSLQLNVKLFNICSGHRHRQGVPILTRDRKSIGTSTYTH